MGSAMESRSAGEKTVAVADLNHIIRGPAGSHDGSCTAVLPEIQIVLCIECNHTTSRGSAGGLDPHTVPGRAGQKSVRICFSQIILGQERQLLKIIQSLNIRRRHTLLFHQLSVIFVMLIHVCYLLNQALRLQFLDLLHGHGLDLRLEILFHQEIPPLL